LRFAFAGGAVVRSVELATPTWTSDRRRFQAWWVWLATSATLQPWSSAFRLAMASAVLT
jgi:hypothetical protein